ncbi:MAG: hypothetical protein EOO68_38460, partial [Moraxellaceae bacterium]
MAARDSVDQLEFDQFRQFLEDACGISLGDNKQYLVTNRMRRLMDEHKIASFAELVRNLKMGVNRNLKEQVIDAMTTNETFWFRDIYPYEHLKDTLFPQLMGGNNKMFGPVRVWSAACSSGQEPYSISMMVEEYRQKSMGALARPVQIVATDLSATILDQARKGEYDKLSVTRGLSGDRLEKFFDKIIFLMHQIICYTICELKNLLSRSEIHTLSSSLEILLEIDNFLEMSRHS